MKSLEDPPPRRKACNGCVKAKRRCDLLAPQCTRCFQKELGCIYGGQAPRRRQQLQNSTCGAVTPVELTNSKAAAGSDPLMQPASISLNLPEFNFDAVSFEMSSDPNTDFGFMEFVPMLPIPPFPEDYPSPPTLLSSEDTLRVYGHEDYEHLDDICDDYNSEQLNDDTTRVACAVAALRNWHRSMAFSFSTPFLHRKLYGTNPPKLITDVFTSCLMFATRTSQTEDFVIPMIENNASALIIEHSGSENSPTVALARVQALLLYQSIRKPHYVDRDLPILEDWITFLIDLRDKTNIDLTSPIPSDLKSWDAWVFWECVSRTVLAAAYFINVHCLIAKGEHPLGAWTKSHPWTASKQLWNADSSNEFFDIRKRRKPLTVCNIFLNRLIAEGDGDEVDAFASMLMVPCLGLAGTKNWISDTRGRVLEDLDSSVIDLAER